MKDYSNLIGKRFGKLIVIETVKIDGRGNIYCICKCDCGRFMLANKYKLFNGRTKSCSCSQYEKLRTMYSMLYTEINKIFGYYKGRSKKRNIFFNLSKEEFKMLIEGDCYYCGSIPSNMITGNIKSLLYNGIDRINNNKGYEIDNCVSCCKTCNIAKNNLSFDEFTEWIHKIIEYNAHNKEKRNIKLVYSK